MQHESAEPSVFYGKTIPCVKVDIDSEEALDEYQLAIDGLV